MWGLSNMEQLPTWLSPRQRILQRDGRRLSIRLEEEFWEQLDLCAKDQGCKISDLVFRLFEESRSKNKSSMLRAYCARWMRKKAVQAHLSTFNADIQGILTSCPVPCVIVSREKRLVAQNEAFSERILGSLVSPDMWDEADAVVRFSLGQPINKIIRSLADQTSPYIETNVAFNRGSAIVQLIGRFCLLSPRNTDASPLLCFLSPYPQRKT